MSSHIITETEGLRVAINGVRKFLHQKYRKQVAKPFLVGIGKRGSIVIPILALNLDFPFILLRKDGEVSHDSYKHVKVAAPNTNYDKYIIVDDFSHYGVTVGKIKEEMGYFMRYANLEAVIFYKMYNEKSRMKAARKAAGRGVKIYPFIDGNLQRTVLNY